MLRFVLFGIPVTVEPFFWLVLLIFGSRGSGDMSSPDELFRLVLFVLAGFISILVHELGHALVLKKFRVPSSIVLQAFGGYAAYPAGILSRPQSFLVTLGGPVVQLVLSLLAYLILKHADFLADSRLLEWFFATLCWISLVWALLNLIPVVPLDGGQLVNALLGPRRIKLTLIISIVTSVVAAGVVFYYNRSFIFPLFLLMFGFQSFKALQNKP